LRTHKVRHNPARQDRVARCSDGFSILNFSITDWGSKAGTTVSPVDGDAKLLRKSVNVSSFEQLAVLYLILRARADRACDSIE
jgi:hypothetical protein